MRNEEGKEIWEGYCIDFIQKLSEVMQFDYDLIIPEDQEFGKKLPNAEWNGLIGDLARGVSWIFSYDICTNIIRRSFANWSAWTILVGHSYYIHSSKPLQETDIAIAALTMTSEREEVIDFVAPYFEQSGILIGN